MNQNFKHRARRRFCEKYDPASTRAPARREESPAITIEIEVVADAPKGSHALIVLRYAKTPSSIW